MKPHNPASALHVAVGVVRNRSGEVLIAQRPVRKHQGGLWEFPGGKVEPGETADSALRRELREELGIAVEQASPLIKLSHAYPDRVVLLDVWQVETFSGQVSGLEGQPIRWVAPDALPQFGFPAANRPIVAAARLPTCYPIVDGAPEHGEHLLQHLERLCQNGHTLAQWRVKSADGQTCPILAQRAADLCRASGLRLLLNAAPELALATGAAGVHLTGRRLLALRQRPLPAGFWVAASCHSLEDLRHAEQIGVDFAVLSPVLPTPSHPDAAPLGWDCFGAWVEAATLPVYALGGMSLTDVPQVRQSGGQGVSGIRGFL
ncbi:MAG: Nudix family hydrolase [Candidatus Methylumidiphilus sp.]